VGNIAHGSARGVLGYSTSAGILIKRDNTQVISFKGFDTGEIKTYTITYDVNGTDGDTVPENQTKTHGGNLTISTNSGSLARTGYKFVKWNTQADGSGTDYVAGISFTVNEDIALYAKWGHKVGDICPTVGYIFYDKGEYSEGWRYLEAAPAGWSVETDDPAIVFGYYLTDIPSKVTVVGTGQSNTEALVSAMGDEAYLNSGGSSKGNYAAKLALDYNVTVDEIDYDDWFLPSKDELNEMHINLYGQSLGGLARGNYWSSSESGALYAWRQFFSSGYQDNKNSRDYNLRVRPVRSFWLSI
jgi:uncharacterized repeat protein (TIGR02543 family)